MAFPPLVVTGQIVAASHINSIRNGLITWGGNVSGGGNNLSSVGAISAASGAFTGAVSAASVAATGAVSGASASITGAITCGSVVATTAVRVGSFSAAGSLSVDANDATVVIRRANGGTNAKIWDIETGSGTLAFRAVNDAYSSALSILNLLRTGEVGLGTAAPTRALHIVRAGAVDVTFAITNGAANTYISTDSTGSTTIQNDQSQPMRFAVGGSERLRVGSATGEFHLFGSLPGPYADNAAAVSAGLGSGRLYRDSSNNVKQVQ